MSGLRLGQKMRERLREERESMAISANELARRICVDPAIWEQVEDGRACATSEMYISLAVAGVDVTYVFNGWREEVVTPIFHSVRAKAGMSILNPASERPSPVATVSIPDREDWPMFRGHRLEIPEGWRALSVVFLPARDGCPTAGSPDSRDPWAQDFERFEAGVLLCRPEADDRAAAREFEAGVWREEVCPLPDGRCLRVPQGRSGVAVLPLAYSSAGWTDRAAIGGCLVLMPLVRFPHVSGRVCPVPVLIVDGRLVDAPWAGDEGLS